MLMFYLYVLDVDDNGATSPFFVRQKQIICMQPSQPSPSYSTMPPVSPLQRLAALAGLHPERTGYRLFAYGGEAFALRAVTAAQACHTLDIQTYILEDGQP